ncbi:DUF2214 family protein [Granulosicoccaceae sp. 1_MG-2023]|nr:DUF2214 family protein [Granulosicoccaceae sp. 1_MG-2023]
MTLDLFIRYIHFLGIISLSSALVLEHALIDREMSPTQLRRLVRIDAIYGLSALILLVGGLGLWFWVGKPAAFYSANPLFHIKVTLFLIMAAISVYPTLFFIRNRNAQGAVVSIPKAVVMAIRVELLLLIFLPLLAVLMAAGVGARG